MNEDILNNLIKSCENNTADLETKYTTLKYLKLLENFNKLKHELFPDPQKYQLFKEMHDYDLIYKFVKTETNRYFKQRNTNNQNINPTELFTFAEIRTNYFIELLKINSNNNNILK